jgi:hypothetical protein
MPNWCNNTITVVGPEKKIRALWEAAHSKEDAGLLEAMVPQGEWDYDHAVAAWGTKWDISMEGLQFTVDEQGRGMITGWAESAWSPPIEAFQTYAAENSDCQLEIKYFEPGMSFIGVWNSDDGDALWEDVGSLLDTDPEDDVILYDLLDHFNVWDWYDTEEDAA